MCEVPACSGKLYFFTRYFRIEELSRKTKVAYCGLHFRVSSNGYLSKRQKSPSRMAGTCPAGQTVRNSSSFLCCPAERERRHLTRAFVTRFEIPSASFRWALHVLELGGPQQQAHGARRLREVVVVERQRRHDPLELSVLWTVRQNCSV